MTERDEAVIKAAKQKRLKKLQNKQKEVDKIDQEKPMYYLVIVLKLFIQLGCALLASCGVTAFVSDFVDNPYIAASISIAMLVGIEFVIHLSGTSIALAKSHSYVPTLTFMLDSSTRCIDVWLELQNNVDAIYCLHQRR